MIDHLHVDRDKNGKGCVCSETIRTGCVSHESGLAFERYFREPDEIVLQFEHRA